MCFEPKPYKKRYLLTFDGEQAPYKESVVKKALELYDSWVDEEEDKNPDFNRPGKVFAEIINERYVDDTYETREWEYEVGVGNYY